MKELPDGWIHCSISDLGDLRLGKMLDKAKNRGLPAKYLRNINVRWFRFDLENLNTIRVSPEELRLLSIQDGDLLICEGGEPGRCAVWNDGKNDFVYQKALHRFRGGGAILPKLLMYCLRLDADTGALARAFTGTTIRHLTGESLAIYTVPVPPLAEQTRIADKVDSLVARIDACRGRLDRLLALIKRFRHSVLAAATSGRLTEEWRASTRAADWMTVPLETVAKGFSYGTSAKSAKSGEVPVLRMGNIQDGRLDWTELVYTSDKAQIDRYALQAGDVLFNRTNSPELVGKTAVYNGERRAVYAGYLIRVRCGDSLLPNYLSYSLNSPAGREFCWQQKSDGVSQSNINAEKLKRFPIAMPSIAEQKEIVRRVERFVELSDRVAARLAVALAKVERLQAAILTKAFCGELVPQNPKDEPANILLERLRTAREASSEAQPQSPRAKVSNSAPRTHKAGRLKQKAIRADVQ